MPTHKTSTEFFITKEKNSIYRYKNCETPKIKFNDHTHILVIFKWDIPSRVSQICTNQTYFSNTINNIKYSPKKT